MSDVQRRTTCPIESYRQGDVLIFRDRGAKASRSSSTAPRASSETPADHAVDIGDEARCIIARLRSVDHQTPNIDRTAVEHAIFEHLAALDLPEMPVRWINDVVVAQNVIAEKTMSTAWYMATTTAWRAAWDEAMRAVAIWGAATTAVWSGAMSAGWGTTWNPTVGVAMSAAMGASWGVGWSAVKNMVQSATDRGALDRACAVWTPLVDAYIAGLWLYWVGEDEVIAVPRPATYLDGHRLHRADGPAIEWPNGRRYWFWRGVQVPEDVILSPERITPERIDSERNVEVRRVLIERYGIERYMQYLWPTMEELHRDRFGVLLRRHVDGDEPIVLVQVTNSTPEPDGSSKVYLLRVHPELRPMLDDGRFGEPQAMTAHNAVASTFGLTGAQYDPVVQT